MIKVSPELKSGSELVTRYFLAHLKRTNVCTCGGMRIQALSGPFFGTVSNR